MDREEPGQIITRKCREKGCEKEVAKKHFALYVLEKWDVHPPADFIAWMKRHEWCTNRETGERRMMQVSYENPVTAWNSKSTRDEFFIRKRAAGLGLPENWYDDANRDLGDRTPREVLDAKQTELVTALLSELENGTFAS